MKSGKLISAMALLGALAIPVSLAAQEHPAAQHYKLIDLGTFGGPASAFNIGSMAINSHGVAVGAAETSVSDPPHSNPWPCGPGTYVYHGFEWGKKSGVKDLGALAPVDQDCSNASGSNASGEIAGNSENGKIDPLTGVIEIRAVIWRNGQISDLGTLGGNHSGAGWINDRGQVVGFALNKIPDPYSFFDFGVLGSSNGTQTRAFLRRDGQKMQDLGTLGGPDAFAVFVNQPGQVAGQSYTSSILNPATGVPPVDPFLWEPGGKHGKMIDLGSLGGTSGGPSALNKLGQVVGTSNLAGDQTYHPFLWTKPGPMQDLGTLAGKKFSGVANWINDAGEVVGWAHTQHGIAHAALWKKNGKAYKAHDLGVLKGHFSSNAFNINSKSQIVGCSGTSGCLSAVLWEHGSIIDLNKLIVPGSALQLVWANFISDSGEIAGVGLPTGCGNTDLCGHAYLLIPKKTR